MADLYVKIYPPCTTFIQVTFRDEAEQLYDPAAITWKLEAPDDAGTETIYVHGTDSESSRLSTGLYRLAHTFVAADKGRWLWHCQGTTAPITRSIGGEFVVESSKF